jgi:hypothetical protein
MISRTGREALFRCSLADGTGRENALSTAKIWSKDLPTTKKKKKKGLYLKKKKKKINK